MTAEAVTKPLLLFFYSPTAGSSRRVDAFLAQILQRRRNHDTFLVRRIDVTARPDLAERFRVTETPAVYIIDGGKVVGRVFQPTRTAPLLEMMKPWLQ